MIERYTRPAMGAVWSSENMYATWLRVEIAVTEAWVAEGRVPAEALPGIRDATFDARRIAEIETETRHDLIAFLRNLSERVGPDARWIHLGLTSSDVKDSALALQLRESTDLLLADLHDLRDALATLARRYRRTLMVGRTHNVHAEPTTFGHKVAVWYAEMERHRRRLEEVRREVGVIKISGAVGTHANVPPAVEDRVASALGLQVETAGTQVIQRDRHATYVLELALLACSLDKVATELRNLQHTEILEVEEPFSAGQQGSSAMPHKRNPIRSEQISGLARIMRGYAVPALENVVLWHERDMSNSSVERVVLPDASILTDYMIGALTEVLRGLQVHEDRMRRNLDATHGLIFSEPALTALIESGMSREIAYAIVQAAARHTWETGESFRQVLERDPEVSQRLSPNQLDDAFNLERFFRDIDATFLRLGLDQAAAESRPSPAASAP